MEHSGDGRNFSVPPVVAFWGLLIKYLIIFGYGVTGFVVGVPTLQKITGESFELAWPAMIALLAVLSACGVIVSWWTDKHTGLEYWATWSLIVWLAVYTTALIIRAATTPDHGTAATAWLPAAFCVFPAIRVIMLKVRQRRAHP